MFKRAMGVLKFRRNAAKNVMGRQDQNVSEMAVARGQIALTNLPENDVSKFSKTLKGVFVDLSYNLGLQTSANNILINEPSQTGDSTAFSFAISIPPEDMCGGDVARELETEIKEFVNNEDIFNCALKRKAAELGLEWSVWPFTVNQASVDEFMVTAENGSLHKLRQVFSGAASDFAFLTTTKQKLKDLYKSVKGSVKLKNTSATEFNNSASMFRAMKDNVMELVTRAGLGTQDCRVKVMHVLEDAESKRIKVNYRIRLKADATKKVDDVANILRETFTVRENRNEFIDSFWKKAEKLENRQQRRQSRRASRSPIHKMQSLSGLAGTRVVEAEALNEDEGARVHVGRRKSRKKAEAKQSNNDLKDSVEVVERSEKRHGRRSRRGEENNEGGKNKSSNRRERRSRRNRRGERTESKSRSSKGHSPGESKRQGMSALKREDGEF
jgi:hypothetical protein